MRQRTMKPKHIQHLYWRAGFGVTPKHLESLRRLDRDQIVNTLFQDSKKFTPLTVDTSEIHYVPTKEFFKNPINRDRFLKQSFEKKKELNYAWIKRLVDPDQLLREKMTLFWANHFVCKDSHIVHVIQFNNILREYALGDFRDFVKAISKEAAMIKYLNNKQNIKENPNENFARELMELFTIGIGHYSEEDIKESARAFTGYNHSIEGEFHLDKRHHDYGFKSFFGRMGRYDGDDIIDIILDQEQCAKFICEKIYRYFVNDSVNPKRVKEMSKIFYENYNIEELMKFVFNSDWFYEEENIGVKIKSPIELLVGMQNIVPLNFFEPHDLLKIQRLLGQMLLNPPNVSGWKGGQYWIDSNTIMLRLKLPSILISDSYISTIEKDDFSDPFMRKYYRQKRHQKYFKVEALWKMFNHNFEASSFQDIQELLLLCPIEKGTFSLLNNLSKTSKKEYCVQLMSLPEYQMC